MPSESNLNEDACGHKVAVWRPCARTIIDKRQYFNLKPQEIHCFVLPRRKVAVTLHRQKEQGVLKAL